MDKTFILIAILIVTLIYFLSQIPRKPVVVHRHRHPYRKEIVYVNRPVWRMPTGWARPIRRMPLFPVHPAHHLLGPGGTRRFF